MKTRIFLAAFALAAAAGCSTVGNVYDRWFGSVPRVKPAPLVAIQPTAEPRIVAR